MKINHIFNLRFNITAVLIACLALTSFGETSQAYNFLNITSSARTYGLGGVNITTVDDDINSIDQNPALLGPEFDTQIGFNYMRYIADANFAGAKFGTRSSEHSAWALGMQYYGYGSIKATDISGNITGDFSPKDLNLNATYSHDINDRWRGGATLKFLYSSYGEYTALAIATDLGVNYYDSERDLSFSIVAANIGGQVKRFDQVYERVPFDLRIGWAQSFGSLPIRFSITAWNLTKWKLPYLDPGDGSDPSAEIKMKSSFMSNLFRHLVFGADFIPSDRFHIGIGYNYKTRTDMSTYSRSFLSGLSVCAGINVKAFKFGIAFAQPHNGASTFMFNISANISEFTK